MATRRSDSSGLAAITALAHRNLLPWIMAHYTVTEVRRNLSQLIDKALAGEEVLITRRGKLVAELVSRAGVPTTTL